MNKLKKKVRHQSACHEASSLVVAAHMRVALLGPQRPQQEEGNWATAPSVSPRPAVANVPRQWKSASGSAMMGTGGVGGRSPFPNVQAMYPRQLPLRRPA